MTGPKLDSRAGGATALAVAAAIAFLPACDKLRGLAGKGKAAPSAVAAPPTPPAPVAPAAADAADVPFKGTYTRYAKATYDKNGRKISTLNAKGVGTLTIEPGKVIFDQTYTERSGAEARVTQTYSFTESDVRPITGAASGFDVKLTFVNMDSSTKSYYPDDRNPKLQARKLAQGWQFGLLVMDGNGVNGGQEFR